MVDVFHEVLNDEVNVVLDGVLVEVLGDELDEVKDGVMIVVMDGALV